MSISRELFENKLSPVALAMALIIFSLSPPLTAYGQTEPESDEETPDGYSLEEVDENAGGVFNHTFWGVDVGLTIPTGSSARFNSPLSIDFFEAPRPFSDYYRESYTANFYVGVITELGFEASISFRITKINYSNEGQSIINEDNEELIIGGVNSPIADFSSYLLGTQVYIGQRMKPINERGESLYFGVAAELSTLKHYSRFVNTPEEGTYSFSFIVGDEIPIQKDPHTFQMLTLRLQGEFVALASNARPRFFQLTFGVRGYIR